MKNKLVLVTGATRGLGLAVTQNLQAAGYSVVATGRKLTPALEDLIQDGPCGEGSVHYKNLDLSDFAQIHPALNEIVQEFGDLYGLVNNAAIASDGVLATMHETQIAEVINVNVTGTLLVTKYAVRSMLMGGVGRVVNISSIIASSGFNGLSVYGASKSALIGFSKSLARELGKAAITVNAVSPGYMKTDMSAALDKSQIAAIIRRSPLGSLVDVKDVAHTVRYLLSPEAAMITGANFTVDAGSTC